MIRIRSGGLNLPILSINPVTAILSVDAVATCTAVTTITALATSAAVTTISPSATDTALAASTTVTAIATIGAVLTRHPRTAMATLRTGRCAGFTVFSRCTVELTAVCCVLSREHWTGR